MNNDENHKNSNNSEIKKQNEDLPNIPASSEKIDSEKKVKKQITETSKLQDEGKTDNTEKRSEN